MPDNVVALPSDDTASVAVRALADLAAGWQALEMRRKQVAPAYPPDPHTLGPASRDRFNPNRLPIEEVRREMTKPLRIVLTFDDPMHTRREIEMLAPYLVQALAVSQDHSKNGYTQAAEMRWLLRSAVREIEALRGRHARQDR